MKSNAPGSQWQKLLAGPKCSLYQEARPETLFEVRWKRAIGSYGRRRFNAERMERAVALTPIVAGLEAEQPKVFQE